MNFFEQLVFDQVERQKLAAFLPYKDRGVDCLVTRANFRGRPQRVQVKGSRGYPPHGGAWFQFTEHALKASVEATDFWVFVSLGLGPKGQFRPEFVVIPTADLVNRLKAYSIPSKSKDGKARYNLYLAWSEPAHKGRVVDTRGTTRDIWPIPADSPRDYTTYSNGWDRLASAIGA